MPAPLRAPFRIEPAATRRADDLEPAQRPASPPARSSSQPAQGWVQPRAAQAARPQPTGRAHAANGSLRDDDFVQLFSEGWISVADLQQRARSVGRGAEIARAIASADLDGDGKISGEDEARALFKALDKFDHDGSTHTIKATTGGLLEWLETAFHPNDQNDDWQSKVTGRLNGGRVRPGDSGAGAGGSGDTLSPVANPGSTLVNGQRLNRRYVGSGPVEVTTGGGRVQAFQYTGGMNVDTDGGTSRLARNDRYYQSQTSMKWAGNKSLNADRIPFIVLPPSVAQATGAKLGDLVEVKMNGKSMYAIYGDVGPSMKLGEGSLMLAQAFNPRAGPNIGIDRGVTTTVLPGSGARFGIRPGGPEHSAADIQKLGEQAFDEMRDKGYLT